jgi:hypothetical protein
LAASQGRKDDGFGVITTTLDLESGEYTRRTVFNFEKDRRIEHYRLITERIGVKTEV